MISIKQHKLIAISLNDIINATSYLYAGKIQPLLKLKYDLEDELLGDHSPNIFDNSHMRIYKSESNFKVATYPNKDEKNEICKKLNAINFVKKRSKDHETRSYAEKCIEKIKNDVMNWPDCSPSGLMRPNKGLA